MPAADRGECLWIVSQDEELAQRAEEAMNEQGCRVRRLSPEALAPPTFWRTCPRYPGAVLLDVGEELDWARSVLKRMKSAHVPSPVIIATANTSREFGTKIVSTGVSYILPRAFTADELVEVFLSLVRPARLKA